MHQSPWIIERVWQQVMASLTKLVNVHAGDWGLQGRVTVDVMASLETKSISV
jgi:hypothetical protein